MVATLLLVSFQDTQQQSREDRQKDVIKKLYTEAQKHLVSVSIYLKEKSRVEKMEKDEELYDEDERHIDYLRENRQTLDIFGVVIDSKTVLIPDNGLTKADIDKIIATDSSGKTFECETSDVMQDYDAVMLKPTNDAAINVEAVGFSPVDRSAFALGNYYYAAYMEKADEALHINVAPYIVTNAAFETDRSTMFLADKLVGGALIADESGNIVGIALDEYLWIDGGRDSFIGKNIVTSNRISFANLEDSYKKIETELSAGIKELNIYLREDKSDYGSRYRSNEKDPSSKLTFFGAVIDKNGTIFIPCTLDRDDVQKIEEVALIDKDGVSDRKVTCKFVGLFKELGGIVVKADDNTGLLPPSIDYSIKSIEAGKLFFSLLYSKKLGKNAATVGYNRVLRTTRSVNNILTQVPKKDIKVGSFVVNDAGSVVGVFSIQKKEEDIEELAAQSTALRKSYSRNNVYSETDKRIFLFSELKGVFENLEPHFDKKAVPLTKKESSKVVWLGVEFQGLGKSLSKHLGIESQTNDGKKGLLVTTVYPNSPAELLGVVPGNILLTINVAGRNDAIDLAVNEDLTYYRYGNYSYGRRSGGDTPPPWKDQMNYLNLLLTEIGSGKSISLKYLSGNEIKEGKLTTEDAPITFDGADKYKDEEFGFTVKDLTYEVKQFQRFTNNTSGVVVSKVEPGSKAEVAKVPQYSVIKRVNSTVVKDIKHFEVMFDEFKRGKEKSITLEVVFLGQTKLLDIGKE